MYTIYETNSTKKSFAKPRQHNQKQETSGQSHLREFVNTPLVSTNLFCQKPLPEIMNNSSNRNPGGWIFDQW